MFYTVIVVTIQSPFYLSDWLQFNEINQLNWFDITKGFVHGLKFFPSIGVIILAYHAHIGALPVLLELTNNTKVRIQKVYRLSIFVELVVFLLSAGAGFITVCGSSPELVIFRETLNDKLDFFMLIALVATCFSVLASSVANFIALKITVNNLINEGEEMTTTNNVIITVAVLGLTTTVAVLYTSIQRYMSIVGGCFANIIMLLIPSKTLNRLALHQDERIRMVSLQELVHHLSNYFRLWIGNIRCRYLSFQHY